MVKLQSLLSRFNAVITIVRIPITTAFTTSSVEFIHRLSINICRDIKPKKDISAPSPMMLIGFTLIFYVAVCIFVRASITFL